MGQRFTLQLQGENSPCPQTGHDIRLNAERLLVISTDSYLLVTVPAAHTHLKNKHSFLILQLNPTEQINGVPQTLKTYKSPGS